ncbi:MAG: ubiquinol-cytochrome c reductase iron-sulfur subunit [Gemmatimonadales bacterium]
MDRREFLERTLAMLGAGALAACAAGAPTAPGITAFSVQISDYPALAAVGGIAVVDTGSKSGEPVAVSRTAADTFVALSLVCPHRGFTVEVSPPGFYCPGHGATFAADGAWTGGQQTSSLAAYHTSYDSTTGRLQIS